MDKCIRIRIRINKYIKTAAMSALGRTNGGVAYLLPDIAIRVLSLVTLLYLWRAAMSSGAEVGMGLGQMLSYTYASALLSDMLSVKTAASGWLSEGVLLKLYGRPMPVLGQLVAQTAGGWLPALLMFSLPMAAAAPLLGVNPVPASPLFPASLLLCIALGFAVDFLFACLSIRLRSMNWLIDRARVAIAAVLSGTIIPIRLLPFGLSEAMRYQPFASLGGAPLSIFAGTADAAETIALQIAWNAVLWPAALLAWKKSQEGMVSYGG